MVPKQLDRHTSKKKKKKEEVVQIDLILFTKTNSK